MVSKLEKLGVISICLIAINFARFLLNYWERKSISRCYRQLNLKSLGRWAVVLGADKNLGRAYAVELAKRGLNVVLLGEESSKLYNLSSLLEKYFQVFTGVILLMFTLDEFEYIEKVLSNLDIAVLVNAPDFKENPPRPENSLRISDFVASSSSMNRNLTIMTKLCAIVMPGMVSKGKGIIVNVISVDSASSCRFLALYKASTAYVEKLSEELRNEYSYSGVIVQSVLPGYILKSRPKTKMNSSMVSSKVIQAGRGESQFRLQEENCLENGPESIIRDLGLWIREFCSETTASTIRMIENIKRGVADRS